MVAYFAGTYVDQAPGMKEGMTGPSLIVRGGFGQARMPTPNNSMTDSVAVGPRFLGYNVRPRTGEGPRHTFVRAMLETDLFAKAMVGRTWAELLGHGIVDPWDDLGGPDDPKHPALLVRLAEDFRASGYNIKHLIGQIVMSTAYARSSTPPPGAPQTPEQVEASVRAFARAGIRPLTPEQLFRTIATVTGASVMARHRTKNEVEAERALFNTLREYRFTFDDDEMAEANKFDGSMPQQLLLLNGELTNEGARVGPEGVLGGILRFRHDPGDRLDEMMLAAYTRRATPEEKALFTERLANLNGKGERRAYEDLYFALLTSTEAVTNH
jgi:hypothetical protein